MMYREDEIRSQMATIHVTTTAPRTRARFLSRLAAQSRASALELTGLAQRLLVRGHTRAALRIRQSSERIWAIVAEMEDEIARLTGGPIAAR